MNNLRFKALLACSCATVFFLFNLSYKISHNGVSFFDSFSMPKHIDYLTTHEAIQATSNKLPASPLPLETHHIPTSSCVIYGPISSDNKNVIDILLNKSNITSLFNIVERPVYEVYWNLGKDKLQAINLFEMQKNEGPLQDEKYKIALNENKDFVVSISTITANESMAKDLTHNISIKANKINAGGSWEYKNKSTVYFYQTENSAKVPKEVNAVMEKTFSIFKSPCQ